MVFAFITDEHAQGTLRYVKLFFDLFLSSFQVSPAPPGAGPLRAPSTSEGPGQGGGRGLTACLSRLSSLCPGDAGGHSLLLRQQGGEQDSVGAGSRRARGHADGSCPQVQAELLKRWQRWKLGKDLAEEYKQTYSHTPGARNGAGSACEKHQLVSGCGNGLGRSPGAARPGTHYLESSSCGTAEHLALGDRHHCYEFPETTAESHF